MDGIVTPPKRLNLALQGGGAHGAYTWGVLECLLDTPEIEIAAISGTSAGALNGAAVKSGLSCGSREAAKEALEELWGQIGAVTSEAWMPWLHAISPLSISYAIETSFPFMAADAASRMVSPYDLGPFYNNPLAPIVAKFDYNHVCETGGPKFVICATNVRTGKIKIFSETSITPEAIMASACLPTLFQAVEIDGEAYWDGGYTGNPALFPLFDPTLPRDIVVVNINPLERMELPRSARDIQNRINEISFNSSLLRELRAITFVQRLLHDGNIAEGMMKDVLIHMIADDMLMQQLSVATKLVPTPAMLAQLRKAGQQAAEGFLDLHFDKIGHESSVDLAAMFN